ncbi:hypothetical protein BCR35DRAFT_336429 [Leucosporidium creatinivorum]|uniref:Uncharacterized protein n=1 Tax=Leucosporidium creatinivorum TaxID=106004 RepID=A0A1Y2C3Z6_9BASI|nr:hypothetical protein BCR35DRAFT_336429 [Leucosporidium creatinivorum]
MVNFMGPATQTVPSPATSRSVDAQTHASLSCSDEDEEAGALQESESISEQQKQERDSYPTMSPAFLNQIYSHFNRALSERSRDMQMLESQVRALHADRGTEWMNSQYFVERRTCQALRDAMIERRKEAKQAQLEVFRVNELLDAAYEALEGAEEDLDWFEEELEAERRRSASLERELAEARQKNKNVRAKFNVRYNLMREEKDSLAEELRMTGDQLEQQDEELRRYRAAPPALLTDKVSGLRLQLYDYKEELNSTKTDYLELEDRYLALEDEKAALAEQIKSSEAELSAQRIEGRTTTALEHYLALAKGEVSMALHKLTASAARLEQKERAHEQLKASSLAILGPLIAFDLARYYFTAWTLKYTDKPLPVEQADAAALNSINLHHNRNLAAHTTLDDIVNRAELLDQLGGTTLAKTLVPLLKLDRLKRELAAQIEELNKVDDEGSLLFAGEERSAELGASRSEVEGTRQSDDALDQKEGSKTPRARTQPLPPSPQAQAKLSPDLRSPIDGAQPQRRPTRTGSALQSTSMKAPRRSRRALAGAEAELRNPCDIDEQLGGQ